MPDEPTIMMAKTKQAQIVSELLWLEMHRQSMRLQIADIDTRIGQLQRFIRDLEAVIDA